MRNTVALSMLLLVALPSCRTARLVNPDPIRLAGPGKAVRAMIIQAMAAQQWHKVREGPGRIHAQRVVIGRRDSRHEMNVLVAYGGDSVSIEHEYTKNLRYSKSRSGVERIHKRYHVWVARLRQEINRRLSGMAAYTFAPKTRYEGEFSLGQREGLGTQCYPDGAVYKGAWEGDKRHGSGTETRADGWSYAGEWGNDSPNGSGTLTSPGEWIHEGAWLNGVSHGPGTRTSTDGRETMKGDWRNGKPHGTHVQTNNASGNSLTIEYDDGEYVRSFGTWVSEGTIYEMELWDHARLGIGTIRYKDGRTFIGECSDQENQSVFSPDGQGSMTWADGQGYEGAWNNGTMHGEGTLTRADGVKLSGLWWKDQLSAWSWSENKDWPQIDTPVDDGRRLTWREDLRELWSNRERGDPGFVLSGLLLWALEDEPKRGGIAAEIRQELLKLSNATAHVVFGEFEDVTGTYPALAVEIQEDTVRNLRQLSRGRLEITDWDIFEQAQQELARVNAPSIESRSVDFLVMVKLAGIQLDEHRQIATSSGKVEVDRKVYPNPVYYDLLTARTSAEGMLARIRGGAFDADASANERTSRATLPLLFGGINARNMSRSMASATLLGSLVGLAGAGAERSRAKKYEATYQNAQRVVNQLGRQLANTSKTIEEPVYYEFRHEDQYVTKKAIATAFVKIVDPLARETIVFDRKIVADISRTDTYKEADATAGREGDPLDLPSDFQMRRDVATALINECVEQLQEGFLGRIGLEHYVYAVRSQNEGNAELFSENAVAFLVSPAAVTHPALAEDMIGLLGYLVRQATKSEEPIDLTHVLAVNE